MSTSPILNASDLSSGSTPTRSAPNSLLEEFRLLSIRGLHKYVIEPFLADPEAVDTGGHVPIRDMDVISDNFQDDYHYGATPRLMIRWIHRAIPGSKRDWTFVDVGAGRGRVMVEAAKQPYKQVVGIELVRGLKLDADANLAAMDPKTVKAEMVDNRLADATTFDVPAGPLVFYLANTLGGELLQRFLDHVLDHHATSGSEMLFFYMNPESPEVFAAEDRLEPFAWNNGQRFKLMHLSPYKLLAYQTKGGAQP